MQNFLQNGLLMCARYAFMPNKLKYCGGDQNSALFELTVTADSSSVLHNALSEFETLYPYLTLIAKENNIRDPFDYRVVEAYWLGNELLENVKIKGLYNHFVDGLHLKKKMTPKQFELMMGKIPAKALPHHSFHVFNIWLRAGKAVLPDIVETMDQCRISWGKIIRVGDSELEVKSPRLIIPDPTVGAEYYSAPTVAVPTVVAPTLVDRTFVAPAFSAQKPTLIFSSPQITTVQYKMLGETFIKNPQVGDWISIHWGWACDKLSKKQVKNLEKYTLHNLQLAK